MVRASVSFVLYQLAQHHITFRAKSYELFKNVDCQVVLKQLFYLYVVLKISNLIKLSETKKQKLSITLYDNVNL